MKMSMLKVELVVTEIQSWMEPREVAVFAGE